MPVSEYCLIFYIRYSIIGIEKGAVHMVIRKEYLSRLLAWKNEQVIKVVTGIRRCGKSTLLKQFQDHLLEDGVSREQIISINFEDLDYEYLLDYKALYAYIRERLCPDKMTYIFLDEIQKVDSFQKAVDSLFIKENTDIYITGSNAYLLSGDLATLLTGRFVEISMLPLSFAEYLECTRETGEQALASYMKFGGFPYLSQMENTAEKVDIYLEGIYNTVVVKDIEDRQLRKNSDPNRRKITDITLLKTVARYLASVVGSPVSVKRVSDYLISSGRKVSPNTVDDYMEALREAFIFYPVERFDINGKQLLKVNRKWYIVDLGLRNHILPKKQYDLGFFLENIVFFELLRRGYRVNVGKNSDSEVDFVAQKQGVLHYYQVTADMTNEDTFNREIRPLQSIKDNYEKMILTMDHMTPGDYEGIQVVHLLDWLLEKNEKS